MACRLPWSGVARHSSIVSVTVVPLLTRGAVDLIGPLRPFLKCQVQSFVAAAVIVGILLLIVKLVAECTGEAPAPCSFSKWRPPLVQTSGGALWGKESPRPWG